MASVVVVGAGAVGSYYGALLARDGHEVTLVARGSHLDALRSRGAVVVREADGSAWEVPVRAAERPDGPPDLAIVATKSHHTLAAARDLDPVLPPGAAVLSLQNGVENVARIGSVVGAGRVLGAIAFVGLRVEEPGVVDHEAEGWVRMGDPAGLTDLARAVHALLAPSWDVTLSDRIVRDQWHKLLWNVGFNALCAVTGATCGQVWAVPEAAALVRQAMEEVVAIGAHRGIGLTEADVDEMAAFNPELRGYRPSTARDLDRGKPVERDALCGFVVREGAALGLPSPVNAVLDALLALQEARALGRV